MVNAVLRGKFTALSAYVRKEELFFLKTRSCYAVQAALEFAL
jgi:hypothetical protein